MIQCVWVVWGGFLRLFVGADEVFLMMGCRKVHKIIGCSAGKSKNNK